MGSRRQSQHLITTSRHIPDVVVRRHTSVTVIDEEWGDIDTVLDSLISTHARHELERIQFFV